MAQCSYCRESVVNHRLRAHSAVCLANPKLAESVRSTLRRRSCYGVLMSQRSYILHIAGRDGMPSQSYLQRHLGTWSNVALWAGLRPQSELYDAIWKASKSLMVDLSFAFYDGQYGPSQDDWETRRDQQMPSAAALLKRLRTWSNVLAWAGGLEEASPNFYANARRIREAKAAKVVAHRMAVRKALAEAEESSVTVSDGVPVMESPKEVVYYDWTYRCYRKRSAASVR